LNAQARGSALAFKNLDPRHAHSAITLSSLLFSRVLLSVKHPTKLPQSGKRVWMQWKKTCKFELPREPGFSSAGCDTFVASGLGCGPRDVLAASMQECTSAEK